MIVVTTPTGQIGGQVLAQLVAAGESVRVVARDRTRIAPELRDRAALVEGSHADPTIIARAIDGAEAVFWCVPPSFHVADVMQYYLDFTRPLAEALPGSSVRRVVFVSSGGRGRSQAAGVIGVAHAMEELLEATGVGLRSLRCGAFMENMLQQVQPLRDQGMFANPVDGDVPLRLCATRDIAARAVDLLRDRSWTGQAGAAVDGPADLSSREMAEVLSRVLGRPIRHQEVPMSVYKATLIQHGASEAMSQSLADMWLAFGKGLLTADPRTPESTTPTTFATWCGDTLQPAIEA